ncbi:MAG: hypothetical protein GY866_10450 [Proteobacteria bacterium]|nr:hypothetical protein [Pseudomonadota bacterium]
MHKQIDKVKVLHDRDLTNGFGAIYLPNVLERRYPNANRVFNWQYLFPANNLSIDPRSGIKRRHHVSRDYLQKAVKNAIRKAGINKKGSCHTFPSQLRHAPAGSGIRHS